MAFVESSAGEKPEMPSKVRESAISKHGAGSAARRYGHRSRLSKKAAANACYVKPLCGADPLPLLERSRDQG